MLLYLAILLSILYTVYSLIPSSLVIILGYYLSIEYLTIRAYFKERPQCRRGCIGTISIAIVKASI